MIYLTTGQSAKKKLRWFLVIYLATGYFAKKETTMVSRKYSWFHVIYLRTGYSAKGNQTGFQETFVVSYDVFIYRTFC